jgi:phenylalanyl-tRNA synthetase beta chain
VKISLAWLHELVDFDLDGAALARALTMAGLEVEGVSTFGAFSGVIAAEVRGKKPHQRAEADAGRRLRR